MEKDLQKILTRLKNYQKNASGVQHNQFVIELPYIQEFIKIHINNLGDPFFVPKIPLDPHTFPEEREIIRKFCEFLKLNPENMWGYCSSCGSEGNLSGIRYGREVLSKKFGVEDRSNITLFYSNASHYSIMRAGDLLNIRLQEVVSTKKDEIDLSNLENIIIQNLDYYRQNGIILCLTLGTTMTCGYDDINGSIDLLNKLEINKKFIHIDGALGGLIMPFFDITKTKYNEIDSIAVSGHKILGLPFPAGVFITKKEYWDLVYEYTPYISKKDGTLFGSRNGLSILYLYIAVHKLPTIKNKVKEMIDLTMRTVSILHKNNVPVEMVKNGLAILLPSVKFHPKFVKIQEKYKLADNDKICHFYVMEHHLENREIIDEFVDDCIKFYNT